MKALALILLASTAAHASPAACAPCHKAETEAFPQAGMTRALEAAGNSAILKANPKLTTRIGDYSYEIAGSNYTVSDGRDKLQIQLEWAFGQGSAGQTYLFQLEGRWYESRVSYFSALHGLDVTIGQQDITPHNLLAAAGRLAPSSEVGLCFDCHASNVVRSPRPDLSRMIEGIGCERCHGPVDAHLASRAPMRKLGALSTEEMSDFCGQCHRTWSQVAMNGPRGILNVRFQPYRLGISKCYDAADNRIRCTACHDPHHPLETSLGRYDDKCLACHNRSASAAVCRVAQKDCVTCHMPRLELPGAHKKFTDHKIRVVKPNEPYPD